MITREHFNVHWEPLVECVKNSNPTGSMLTQAIIGEIMRTAKNDLVYELRRNNLMDENEAAKDFILR
jgi:hypothetical protein